VRHRDTLVPLLAQILRQRRKADWLAALEAAKVPCGAINSLDEVFADPQVRHRAMTVRLPHPLSDALELVASPIKLSTTPVTVRRAPPLLGQHSDEVLLESGFDAAEIARLRQLGVI